MKAEKKNGCCTSFALALGRGFFALALVAFWQVGHAAKSADFGKNAISQNGKSTTIYPMGSINSGGSTIPVTPTVGGWTGAGNYGFPPQATGPTAGVTYKGQFVDGSSPAAQVAKGYPYQATSTVPWSAVAGAIAGVGCGLLSGGAAALTCAAAVPLVMDWLNKGDGRLNPDTGVLEAKDKDQCIGTGTCKRYRNYYNSVPYPPRVTGEEACADGAAVLTGQGNDIYSIVGSAVYFSDNSGGYCPATYIKKVEPFTTGTANVVFNTVQVPGTPGDPIWKPTSLENLVPSMGTPPDGRVIGELLDQGVDLPLSIPIVSGPSSIKGPETTTTNADGSRTVTSTTNNYTTNGNTVTNNSSVTTTTTYNTDNSVRSVVRSETVPTEEEEKEDACKANPERLGCSEMDTPEGKIPMDRKEVSYTAESVWGGGSCPADKVWASQTMGRSYTLIPWSSVCDWAVLMRAVVLIMATWAAFWIVMPGNTQVKPQ